MKFTVFIDGDLNALMLGEYRAGERAVTSAVRQAGTALKADWRGQVTGAGLGVRLGKTISAKFYPYGQPSLTAAAFIYSKAPKIIGAYETGATIRAQNGFWLAIALPAAGNGAYRAKITPDKWEKKTGRRLRFVYRKGRTALLIDEGKKAPGNVMVRRRVRGGSKLSEPVTFKNRSLPMFALVPQVKLRKRLNLYAAGEQAIAGLPAAIVAQWRATR